MIKVVVKPIGNGKFVWRTEAWQTLVEGRSRQPLLDACRKLKSMGEATRTRVALFHEGSTAWALRTTVGAGAALTVKGDDRFHRWQKNDRFYREEQ